MEIYVCKNRFNPRQSVLNEFSVNRNVLWAASRPLQAVTVITAGLNAVPALKRLEAASRSGINNILKMATVEDSWDKFGSKTSLWITESSDPVAQ